MTMSRDPSGLRVLGVGTRMSRDDEVGLRLVKTLSERPEFAHRCTVYESMDAASLAAWLLETKLPILIVDCADMGASGGEARCFSEKDAKLVVRSDSVSTHGLGAADAVALARALGFDAPVHFFGVQPFDLSPRMGLTEEMNALFPTLLERLESSINNLDAGPTRRFP